MNKRILILPFVILIAASACGGTAATEGPIVSTATSETEPEELEEEATVSHPTAEPLPTSAPEAGGQADIPRKILLVTSSLTEEVLGYSMDGEYLGVFATTSDIQWPVGIALGPDGKFYLSSYGHNAILQFDTKDYEPSKGMKFLGKFTLDGNLQAPESIVFRDGYLYVASAGTHKVLQYDAETGKFIHDFAQSDLLKGVSIQFPWSLTFGPDGHLYVDSNTNEIYKFDGKTGESMGVFASDRALIRPAGMTFGPDGHLYVGSQDTNTILKFDGKTGEFLAVFVQGGVLQGPWAVAFGPDEHLYVASSANNKVLKYDGETGEFLKTFIDGGRLQAPNGLLFIP